MKLHDVRITPHRVILDGDDHDHPETTPIYDQLMKEVEG